ncbi:MAG: hypothetical protein ACO3JL_00610 [Myxococcota bacterium]
MMQRRLRTDGAMALMMASLLLLVVGCPEPYYDDDIGLEGVATDTGALAGVFGVKVFAATLVKVIGLPDELGGGFQWLLAERSYDEGSGTYTQTTKLCDGVNLEVHGTAANVPRSTYDAVPVGPAETVTVDHATGEYGAAGLVQLWGIKDLDDPAKSPLPTSQEEAESAAFASKIYDMDGDGEPGYTTTVTGVASGDAYGVLRRQSRFRGVVLDVDHILGLTTTEYDSFVLGASNAAVEALMGSSAPPYPDPKESWFEERRLENGSACADVLALEETGGFEAWNPFY